MCSLGAASVLGNWTQDSLYTHYSKDSVFLAVDRIDEDVLTQVSSIALASPEVRSRLEVEGYGSSARFINYVLPAEWNVPEIPLNLIECSPGHYTLESYNKNLYKIAFTRAEFSESNQNAEGMDILSEALRRVPIAEAWIDLSSGRVIEVKSPPSYVRNEGVPVPIY
jgi:hypothetical protein